MSLFITFEGGEGCGKSLQSRILYRELFRLAIPTALIHEPGGTPLGEKIRYLLKHSPKIAITPLAELLLFNASRCQLVSEIIQPELKAGKIVICDRFTDSTLAYQSYGRGLDPVRVKEINRIGSQGLVPNLTFLLDVPPEIGLSRKKPDSNDRFEKEITAFHQRVRKGFLQMATQEPQRWITIDATLTKKRIATLIWQKVRQLLQQD